MDAPAHTRFQPRLAPQPPPPISFSFSTSHVGGPPTHPVFLRSWEGLSFLTPIFKKPELEDWSRWLRQGSPTSGVVDQYWFMFC